MTLHAAREKAIEGGSHISGADGMDTSDAGAHSAYAAWTCTSPRSACPRKHPFLLRHFGKSWDVRSAGVRRVISRAPVRMGTQSVSAVAATTGCISGTALCRPWRMVTRLKPSLQSCLPRRRSRAGPSTCTTRARNPCPHLALAGGSRNAPALTATVRGSGRGPGSRQSHGAAVSAGAAQAEGCVPCSAVARWYRAVP